jgi:hypothetical protein
VDIDLDISSENTKKYAVADGHGDVKQEILKILIPIFQI